MQSNLAIKPPTTQSEPAQALSQRAVSATAESPAARKNVMIARRQLLLKALFGLGILVIVVGLARFFPVKPLPAIEAGPKAIAHIGVGGAEFPISNSMVVSWIVTIVLIVVSYASTRNMQLIPSGLQNLMEAVIETLNGLVSDIAAERGKRFFPIVATIFLYLILVNWSELLPGVGPIGVAAGGGEGGHALVPLFRASSSDLNTAIGLAIISVFMTQVYSIMAFGVLGYLGRWFNFRRLGHFFMALLGLRPRKGLGGLFFWGVIDVFIGLVELFSETIKLITFSFRLFGNIFAGEVILIVMAYLFAQVLPLPFYALELFVGFIQAFVFAVLTLVFMSMATQPAHGAEEEPIAAAEA